MSLTPRNHSKLLCKHVVFEANHLETEIECFYALTIDFLLSNIHRGQILGDFIYLQKRATFFIKRNSDILASSPALRLLTKLSGKLSSFF